MSLEKEKYKYLAKLIKRGYYKNGKPFLFIDFFKYIDTYDSKKRFVEVISAELSQYFENTDETYKIIVDFVIEHNILLPCLVTREELYKYESYVYERQVTKEMVDAAFDYMEANGYPKINYIYYDLVSKFAKGKIKNISPTKPVLTKVITDVNWNKKKF